jgi:hypothetical protein
MTRPLPSGKENCNILRMHKVFQAFEGLQLAKFKVEN